MIKVVKNFMGLPPKGKIAAFKKFMGDPFGEMKKIADDPVELGLTLFVIVFIVLAFLNSFRPGGAFWDGILTEAHGMLMDILVFGVLLTWFNQIRNKENQIKNYHDQLDDFRFWHRGEGVLRKVGILKRLNEMKASLPNLVSIQMPHAKFLNANLSMTYLRMANFNGAHLTKANFEGSDLLGANFEKSQLQFANLQSSNLSAANLNNALLVKANLNGSILEQAELRMADLSMASLCKANLHLANLEGANLRNANLEMADLREAKMNHVNISQANLQGVKNLTCNQIEYAQISKETKFPDYIKVTCADDDTFTCEILEK